MGAFTAIVRLDSHLHRALPLDSAIVDYRSSFRRKLPLDPESCRTEPRRRGWLDLACISGHGPNYEGGLHACTALTRRNPGHQYPHQLTRKYDPELVDEDLAIPASLIGCHCSLVPRWHRRLLAFEFSHLPSLDTICQKRARHGRP